MKNLKETFEVEDQTQLEQEEDDDSAVNAEDIERAGKAGMVNKKRIERLKRAFRPSWLRDAIDNSGNGIKGKNN